MDNKELAAKFYKECLDDLEHDRLVLPTLPEVALRVRDVVDDPDSSIGEVAKVIATDAALTARIIHVANSPLYRADRPIESLDKALSRLGTKLVRDMATAMVMQQMFQATSEVTDRKLRQIWEHSIQVAAISHALAAQFTRLSPEEAMLGGLVHDLGALPLITKAEDYPELLEREAVLDAVLLRLHGRIGAAILKQWNFPEALVTVAGEHENIERNTPDIDYVDVVIVANLQSYFGTKHPMARRDWNTVPAFTKLGLNPEVSVVDMDETAEDIEATRQMLEP